jgi:drug/metabolite transporter (DMT)-like permease
VSPGPSTTYESLITPRNLAAFLLVSVIWGGTWLVIRDQLAQVPAGWSITYRFVVAALGMFAIAAVKGQRLWLSRTGQGWALVLGVLQFTLNFTFVYNAERFITSGLVAVMFALLVVPNALLGRALLGQPIRPAFIAGSCIAAVGVTLLFAQEYRVSPASLADVLLGAGLTVGGILAASCANIAQALEGAKRQPFLSLLAWAMVWGVAINAAAAIVFAGPPSFDPRPSYTLGILYLGLLGSCVTFPLYYGLVRKVGAGQAAYSSVIVPVVAMILSTLFEGFVWSLLPASGAALTILGMIIALRGRTGPPGPKPVPRT